MVYAVDVVIELVRKLGSSNPVMFERDGSLYVASDNCFGQVSNGLVSLIKEGDMPSEAKDAMIDWHDEAETPEFLEGEDKYVRALTFGKDSNLINIEDITNTAAALSALPDDGKIRIVEHSIVPYGRFNDIGMEVTLSGAHVMPRAAYLAYLRAGEDAMYRNLEYMTYHGSKTNQAESKTYDDVLFPDCLVMTPDIRVSFPRKGRLNIKRYTTSYMNIEKEEPRGTIIYPEKVSIYSEQPFSIYLSVEHQNLSVSNKNELESGKKEIIAGTIRDFRSVEGVIGPASELVTRLNELHRRIRNKVLE